MKRPQDRHGIREGTILSKINTDIFRFIGMLLYRLPNFKGKVRVGLALYRMLGIETHHIKLTATLRHPVKYQAQLDLHSMLERFAYLMAGYEGETVEFLKRCYPNKGYFLDVGANIGLISIPFTKLLMASNSKEDPICVCIEAVKDNCISLKQNIALNGLESKIFTICSGVGEREKDVEIQIEGNLKENHGTGTANILADNTTHICERIPMNITTINQLLNTSVLPDKCSLIKIDVDGYDLKVLQGATQLFKGSRPVIYGEFMKHCLAWHGQTHDDVVDFVDNYDYKVFVREASWRFVRYSETNNTEQDLLLLPKEQITNYRWCLYN